MVSQKSLSWFQVRESTCSIGLLSMMRPGASMRTSPPEEFTVSSNMLPAALPDQVAARTLMSPCASPLKP